MNNVVFKVTNVVNKVVVPYTKVKCMLGLGLGVRLSLPSPDDHEDHWS